MSELLDIVARHVSGEEVGIYSVCSAHPLVLRAALEQAASDDGLALIEATANQVNQYGGYTGQTPAAFRDHVWSQADAAGIPRTRVLLGGDHSGPTCWQSLPAQEALARSEILVSDYVSGGFRKIHLDCSMACAGDAQAVPTELIADRSATLCAAAEAAWQVAGGEPPVYVIGSEVPTPGGAHEAIGALAVTEVASVRETLEAHRIAFARRGVEQAWERVVALVVQPGVEFDHAQVVDYAPEKARALSACLEEGGSRVFEAHSTDYQTAGALDALVRDHFAILKVGPALTYALREALWALDAIEREWRGSVPPDGLRATVLSAMRANPVHWRRYYHGTGQALELELEYSLSDRMRYYWPEATVAAAAERLCRSIDHRTPLTLLRQYLPAEYTAVREGRVELRGAELVRYHVRQTLRDYARACDPTSGPHS